MKLLFFDDFRLGVLQGDRWWTSPTSCKDIPHTGPRDLISGLIARFADYRKKHRGGGRPRQAASPVERVRIRPAAAQARPTSCAWR